ncbi:DUF2019 domain-containing protein [Cohnella faecalis]|uniref:DUF2019 domain-containing protein n=1 Tax=Cohnella faecalis TaxID=2315694 RepID=UPI0013147F6E|nr:DUF2019 domain-containing protein [Cohnella faecalis]
MELVQKQINDFIDAAIQHGECTEIGNSKLGNKFYKKIMMSSEVIKSSEKGKEVFLELMKHPNISVRLWSASFAYQNNPIEAEQVLQDIIGIKKSLVSFTAEITLNELKSGRLLM